ncbi:MAG: hypothetical protein ACE5LU_28925 [Anaerolineae bacterium]
MTEGKARRDVQVLAPSRARPFGTALRPLDKLGTVQAQDGAQDRPVTPRGVGELQRDPRIAPRTPVLEAMAGQLAPNTFGGHVLLVIPHFLKDLPPFVDQLEALGVTWENAFFVPVFYSRREYVQRTLGQEGWQVLAATAFGPAFDQTVRSALAEALYRAASIRRRLMVLEDGGYAVPMLLREFADRLDFVAGAVEQTSNGCWRDREAVAGYEATHRRPIPFPIVAVGECAIKKVVEAPAVADAVLQSVERLLMRDHKGLRGKRVAVMGYGAVGSRVAEAVRVRGASVGVFDRDQQKLVAARNQGFEVPRLTLAGITDDDGHPVVCRLDVLPWEVKSRLEAGGPARWQGHRIWPKLAPDLSSFVSRHSVILGTSGHCSVGAELISALRHGTYLASCSSKRLEIDVVALEAQAVAVESVAGVGTRYVLPSTDGQNRIITLLADGFPVNFWGDDVESIPTEHIEFVWALMLHELTRIAGGANRQMGLCAPDPWAAERVALLYLQHSRR